MAAKKSFQQDAEYFQNKYGLDEATANGRDMTIKVPGYIIYYMSNINEFPEKIQGFRADYIEIMNDCLDEDILNSVIYPMVYGGSELIFIPEDDYEG